MADFVFLYTGGSGMPEDEAEGAKAMQAWNDWYAELGSAIKDGGNPFGAAKTVGADGSVNDGTPGPQGSGYTIVTAVSLDAATTLAKGSPVLHGGGAVNVYEIVEM